MWWLLLFLAVACAELTRTPFGLFPSECVHKVASGSHITTVDTKTVVTHNNVLWTVPPCHLTRTEKRQFPQNYNGWSVHFLLFCLCDILGQLTPASKPLFPLLTLSLETSLCPTTHRMTQKFFTSSLDFKTWIGYQKWIPFPMSSISFSPYCRYSQFLINFCVFVVLCGETIYFFSNDVTSILRTLVTIGV